MPRHPRHDVLFEPIEIGPKTLPNRFMQVPHCTGFGTDRPRSQARFRAVKAEGGWGAVCTEVCAVHPEADRAPQAVARLWDDDDLRNLSLMCDAAHEEGALAGVELFHPGSHIEGSLSREVPGAPSQLPSDAYPMTYPREMSRREIHELIGFFAAAARRAKLAGFDIVYLYGAHGYLPMQFLSPYYNERVDEYGGTLANRARFWLETLEAVRAEVDGDCAIACRLAIAAEGPGVATAQDALEFVSLADPLVDLWDVNVSSVAAMWSDITPSRLYRQGAHAQAIATVRQATAKPLVGVGRLTDADQMAELIASGAWDIIGSARPSIADPFLPEKIRAGRYDDVRECIGCNICRTTALGVGNVACTQNPTAGEEYRREWHPERFDRAENADRTVLVVGGGAAGLECAVVLGKRGFERVHLVDGSDELGGYAALTSRLPGLAEWRSVVTWRVTQLQKLRNVEVIPRRQLSAREVLEYGADLVVVATGAAWRSDGVGPWDRSPLAGADLPHVTTPEQVIRGELEDAERVVVYDCEGYFMGVGIAELLAARGTSVALVTPADVVGGFLDRTHEGQPTRAKLASLNVEFHTATRMDSITESSCHVTRLGRPAELAADAVVLVTARKSDDALYRSLDERPELLKEHGIEALYAVGDCVAPRLIADCVFDGHRLAREIDTADPRRPLPIKRERLLVGGRHERQRSPESDRARA
jgi:dimethylamine/trimethylamine dehydrogenase